MLVNLVSNSLKFTEFGYIKTEISLEGELLKFRVQDTGVGIDQAQINQLQKAFVTFNQNNLNKGGIGLGLYISKQIIQRIGPSTQEFKIESLGKHGSSFSFLVYPKMNVSSD